MRRRTPEELNPSYYKRLKAGLCVICGHAPAEDGKRMCLECAEAAARKSWLRYQHRKASGICTYCGRRQAVEGMGMCAECKAKLAARQHDRYHRMKAKHLCPLCGQKAPRGRTLCAECAWRSLNNKRRLQLVKMGYDI